ncbi:MAG: pyrimidine reductase family protein, partial [Actinomycetales bacterium]
MTGIGRVFPTPVPAATDEELLSWYAPPESGRPWLSFNFVASLDGAATVRGRSGGLGNPSDQRVFALLRRHADAVLVGAGTVRAEGYAGELVDAAARQWRVDHGKPAHPTLVIVSGSLDLDPRSDLFRDAPARPLLVTVSDAPLGRRRALEPVADIMDCGTRELVPQAVLDGLAGRGLRALHCEGGPHLFGSFQDAGLVDELCLTLAPALAGGSSPRIAAGNPAAAELHGMELAHILSSGSMLFLRYLASGLSRPA